MEPLRNILVIVDMQNDFISGVLGSKEAEVAVQNAIKYIENIKDPEKYDVIFTQDTHFTEKSSGITSTYYSNSSEGRHLPILHCEYKTEGWKIHEGLLNAVVNKFDDMNWSTHEKMGFMADDLFEREIERILYELYFIVKGSIGITIFGLCTDICVISNALLLERIVQSSNNPFSNVNITCIADCCAGSSKENHKAALKVMKACHIDIK